MKIFIVAGQQNGMENRSWMQNCKKSILDPPFTGRSKIQFSLCNEERSNSLCFICLSQHGKYPTHT